MTRSHWTRPTATLAAAGLSLALLAGCGSSGGDASPTTTKAEAKATTTAAADAPLTILVGNDDGYAADGIDALVEGLRTVEGVKVVVVAPASNQSGTGGTTTDGDLETAKVETASGYPATSVVGYPADAIRVAMDEQGVDPDLVITGINQGQNIGPLVDVSGTVGAARAAVARGVPALATSQGTGASFDYEAAVPLILDWLAGHRADIAAGKMDATVTNLNVPSCDQGKVRGLLEVDVDAAGGADALKPQDCTSTVPASSLTTDVPAFNNGYATISEVPATPSS
ncbi:MAG: 5'/3'-nucleotidase SurE [Acidimicrobiales bacterium]